MSWHGRVRHPAGHASLPWGEEDDRAHHCQGPRSVLLSPQLCNISFLSLALAAVPGIPQDVGGALHGAWPAANATQRSRPLYRSATPTQPQTACSEAPCSRTCSMSECGRNRLVTPLLENDVPFWVPSPTSLPPLDPRRISCFRRHPTTTTQLAQDERVVALAEGCVPAQRKEGSREVCESPNSLDLRCLKRMPCSGPTPECPHLHTHSPHHLCRLDPTHTCRGRVHSRTPNVRRGKALHVVRSLPVGDKCLFKAANLCSTE
jgi:hypothetical protein